MRQIPSSNYIGILLARSELEKNSNVQQLRVQSDIYIFTKKSSKTGFKIQFPVIKNKNAV